MTGKTAILTGAAGGIGRALAWDLLKSGVTVWAWDLSDEGLTSLRADADRQGYELRTMKVDVTDRNAVEQAARAVKEKDGKIDFWINNAGVAGVGGFNQLTADDFEKVMAINFLAVVTGTRVALKYMEDRGTGSIVNVASVAGHVPAPFLVAYTASKYAVVGFTRALREELRLRDANVKMVLVSPGFVDTTMISRKSKAAGFPEWLSWLLSKPEAVSREIMHALRKGHEEVFPALNGRVIIRMHRYLPRLARRSSKMLFADSFKDFILNRYRIE